MELLGRGHTRREHTTGRRACMTQAGLKGSHRDLHAAPAWKTIDVMGIRLENAQNELPCAYATHVRFVCKRRGVPLICRLNDEAASHGGPRTALLAAKFPKVYNPRTLLNEGLGDLQRNPAQDLQEWLLQAAQCLCTVAVEFTFSWEAFR
jgi:hypothetical protein